MTALTILALVLAIPIMLIPAALVWYIVIGGATIAFKEAREKQAAEHKAAAKA